MNRSITAAIAAAITATMLLAGCGDEVDTEESGLAGETSEPVVGDQDGGIDADSTESTESTETTETTEGTEGTTTTAPTTTEGTTTTTSRATTTTSASGGDQDAGGVIEVIETNFDLSSPQVENEQEALTLTVPRPGTYTFRAVNNANIVHALRVEGHGVEAATGDIPGGESAELTVRFEEAGEYDLYCPVANHKQLGMDGSVMVGG